jgi:PEP-CTERM motif
MKKSIVLAVALAAFSPAWGLVVDTTLLNVNTNLGTLPTSNAVVEFQGSYVQRSGAISAPAVDWKDQFSFHMASSGDFIGEITRVSPSSDVNFFIGVMPNLDTTGAFQLTGTSLLVPLQGWDPATGRFDFQDLAIGDYTLTIFGKTSGNGGAAYYTGVGHAEYVSGVPEPSTYAMMALGLLGIGFAARRRMG